MFKLYKWLLRLNMFEVDIVDTRAADRVRAAITDT
jgi:hypothetical protein